MAPSLIETSYASTDFPLCKKIKSPAFETHVKEVTTVEPEGKQEQTVTKGECW